MSEPRAPAGRAPRPRDREGRLPRARPRAPRGPGRVRAARPARRACARARRDGRAGLRRARAGDAARRRRRTDAARPVRSSPRCGGCAYQELDYAGAAPAEGDRCCASRWRAPARPGTARSRSWPRPRRDGARASALHFEQRGRARCAWACYEEGTHRVVDLDSCLQVSPALLEAAARAPAPACAAQPSWAPARVARSRSPNRATAPRAWRPLTREGDPASRHAAWRRWRRARPGSPASAWRRPSEGGRYVGLSRRALRRDRGRRLALSARTCCRSSRRTATCSARWSSACASGPRATGPCSTSTPASGSSRWPLADGRAERGRGRAGRALGRGRGGQRASARDSGTCGSLRSDVAERAGRAAARPGERVVLDPPRDRGRPGDRQADRAPAGPRASSTSPATRRRSAATCAVFARAATRPTASPRSTCSRTPSTWRRSSACSRTRTE